MFAIAQALKDKGHFVSVAGEGHHADALSLLNISLIKLDERPAENEQLENHSVLSKLRSTAEILQTLSPRNLEQEYEILSSIANDYDLIVGNQLAYTGSMVSKKTGKPWVFCAPSPLAFPSQYDPPLFPYIHRLQSLTMAYPATQRPYITLARSVSRLMMNSVIRQQRRLGIKNAGHPRFEGLYSEHLNLLMTSPSLIKPQPDWPTNTVLSGFSWFEPEFMRGAEKMKSLAEFIDGGPAPIVFAPGGSMRTHPGKFFTESIETCKRMGIRGILLAAQRFHAELPKSSDILITGYVPYSVLLKSASAIVHSGGIGAIGWSLRFGIPSLLVPSTWDQFDNAHRACNQNLAMVMAERNYKAAAVAANLDKLFKNQSQHQLLKNYMQRISDEDGASVACTQIESFLKNVG
ncbi:MULTISPECIES: nucleotide disphospho-sugar-binding domain-containing protein [unclassified Undibacterium]|uniref:glycosyltransferase n=1 Tax=unclassified Undibacterium TaxID=2630295 RepID=UPI003392FF46